MCRHFINNKGGRDLPTMDVMIMMSDALKEKDIDNLPPTLAQQTRNVQRRLGKDYNRVAGDVVLHLATSNPSSDLTILNRFITEESNLVKEYIFQKPRETLQAMPYFIDLYDGDQDLDEERMQPQARSMCLLAQGLIKDQFPHEDMKKRIEKMDLRIYFRRLNIESARFSRETAVMKEEEDLTTVDCSGEHIGSGRFTESKILQINKICAIVASILPIVEVVQIDCDNRLRVFKLNNNKLWLTIDRFILTRLWASGLKIDHVKILRACGSTFNELLTANLFPNLTTLLLGDALRDSAFSWQYMVPIKNLRELRLSNPLNSDQQIVPIFQYIKQLPLLQLLWIYATGFWGNYVNVDVLSMLENPKLRSVSLHQVGRFATADVVAFLRKPVQRESGLILRQDIMEDLTITGYNGEPCLNYKEIYSCEDISQRMKDRIYTNMDESHEAAAVLNLLERGYYDDDFTLLEGSFMLREPIIERKDYRGTKNPLYLRVLNKVGMELSGRSSGFYFYAVNNLLTDIDTAKLYENCLLEETLETVTSILKRSRFGRRPQIATHWHRNDDDAFLASDNYVYEAVDVLDLLADCNISPKDISVYLHSLVALMDGSFTIGQLPHLFIEHSHQLSKPELAEVVELMKVMLTRICFQLIYSAGQDTAGHKSGFQLPRLLRNFNLDAKKFIELIQNHAEDEKLKVATTAVLRRYSLNEWVSETNPNGQDEKYAWLSTPNSENIKLEELEHQLLYETVMLKRCC